MPSLTFNSQFDLGDILTFVALFATALSLIVAIYQIHKSNKASRAQFLASLADQYMNDRDMVNLLYDIEYARFSYSREFHESNDEKTLDKLLGHFDKIAALHLMKCLSWKDLELIQYDMMLVYNDENVQRYFAFLETLPDVRGIRGGGFERFRSVAERIQRRAFKGIPGQRLSMKQYRESLESFFATSNAEVASKKSRHE